MLTWSERRIMWGLKIKSLKRTAKATKLELWILWWNIKNLPRKLKRLIWHKHILLRWHRLWIREDEGHISLSMDPLAMVEMDEEERENYIADLCRRRAIAHNRELARQDAELAKLS